ncbi:MAG: ATP-dependent DNA helicase RecG [Candidatus Paceibacterota bacterium]
MFDLATPIDKLPKVGPRYSPRLKRLGVKTVRDLLWHFPARYEDYSNIVPIAEIKEAGTVAGIKGAVVEVRTTRVWQKRMSIVNAIIQDDSGLIRAVWYNQPYLERSLPEGTMISCAGKINADKKGLYFSNPQYEKVYSDDLTHTGRLVPIYPETRGITSKYIRFLIKPILAKLEDMPDSLPAELVKKYKLPSIRKAINDIHFPKKIEYAELAKQRFALEELILFQLRVLRDHRQLQTLKAPQVKFDKKLIAGFVKSLPFELTKDQRVSAYEILQDLERSYPMNRLLNGDVGSGKTIVALIAAYQAVAAGHQVAFMAPTEILAKQHYQTIKSITDGNVAVGLLTGSEAKQWPIDEITEEKITKKIMNDKVSKGEVSIVIGTHAVIQKNVSFKNLGLVVIDEQHRFGVEQRMKLVKNRDLVPHLLSMTATPIPRTLALTVYGDLDVSLLKEKPKGRQAIKTTVVPDKRRDEAHDFIEKQVEEGRQVFVVCPRIDLSKSDSVSRQKLLWSEVKAVTDEYEKLSQRIFPHRRVVMLHGKMTSAEKGRIMDDFKNGNLDILVSTSVIEVGVDVPNATIMMIESAERFGLAQLHQFRGRVGRGPHQSYCFLFTSSDTTATSRRLKAMEQTDDGFKLAEADLAIRGPGEFGGVKQSGVPDFAMATLTDMELIKKARLEARLLIRDDPTLKNSPQLLARLAEMQRLLHFE